MELYGCLSQAQVTFFAFNILPGKKKVWTCITMLACSIMLDLHHEFALPFYFCCHALP